MFGKKHFIIIQYKLLPCSDKNLGHSNSVQKVIILLIRKKYRHSIFQDLITYIFKDILLSITTDTCELCFLFRWVSEKKMLTHWSYIFLLLPHWLIKFCMYPDSKVYGANMGPTWVLSFPGGPHVGPMNLTIRISVRYSCNINKCPAFIQETVP